MSVKLSKKEKDLADSFARGEFKKKSTSKNLKAIAKNTKDARINLRLHADVLQYFQNLSDQEGIPYQTLINSALYKIASGRLVEKEYSNLAKEIERLRKQISKMSSIKRA